MKNIKQIREDSKINEVSVHLDNPFDSKHGTDHKTEKKHADMMKKNHGVTTQYHRDSGEMSYHGPKKNVKAALHTHYQTDDSNEIKSMHPKLFEEYGAGEWGTDELTNKYKNATPGQGITETPGHESTAAAKASAEATRHPSKENHLKAMEAHKNAQGFFKGRAHDYHLQMAITHAKKASEMKEGASEDMAMHHAAAQAAKKAGDNDAFHKHMDAKFEIAKKQDTENAKKPIVKLGETLTKSNTAGDFIHDFVHSDDPKFSGKSAEERKKMALGAYYAKQNEGLEDACWKGYEAIGMKMKNGRKVPNCVPKESVEEEYSDIPTPKVGHTVVKHSPSGEKIHGVVSKIEGDITAHDPKGIGHGKIHVKYNDGKTVAHSPYDLNHIPSDEQKKHKAVFATESHYKGNEESLDESVHGVKAAKFSQKAKLHPSVATHVRASDAHSKAASAYEKKIAAHIKSGGEASGIKNHEDMLKHHNRSAILHKFMAHRLVKQSMNEAAESAVESADEKTNLKITKHTQLAVNAGKRGDIAAQKFHLAMVSKLKANESTVNEASEYDDNDEEVIMAKGQLLKIADMAKDLAASMDDQDELEAWIQVKITTAYDQMDDVHSYVEYTQDLYDDQPEAEKEFATESTIEPSVTDAKELARMRMLVRLGLLDHLKLNTVTRAIRKLDNNIPVTTIAEKDVLFELLQNLIASITTDDTIFRKVKFNVATKQ